MKRVLVVATVVLFAACAPKDDAATPATDAPAADSMAMDSTAMTDSAAAPTTDTTMKKM
jgi:hypothetical protein